MPAISKKSPAIQRNIALCYVRQSHTRDEFDTNSPDRQRANIQAVCDRNGWTPMWFSDTEGHKSGTKEYNRPEWLRLKSHLSDPHVVALVANDLARLHRKLWQLGRTLEELEQYGIRLALAAPGREMDTSAPQARLIINFMAMQDEAYAADISARAKDSVAFRKSRGITVGKAPFGTVRVNKQYLVPSPYGAWLLPSGIYVAGENQNEPPEQGAIWFGYYDCAARILELYAENLYGFNKLTKIVSSEGWRFQDRKGNPRLIDSEDIRRVTSSWRVYAGLVENGKSKDLSACNFDDPLEVLQDNGRAVFSLDLLRRVAMVQKAAVLRTNVHQVHVRLAMNTAY